MEKTYKIYKSMCGQTEVIRTASTRKEIMEVYNGIISIHRHFGIYVIVINRNRSVLPAFDVEYRVKKD